MKEQIRITTPDGEADAFLFRPAGASSGAELPGILDLPDSNASREATAQSSQMLADQGYLVLSPNIFYRTSRPPVVDFPMNFAEERTQRRFAELATPLTPEAMHADAHIYVQTLDQHGAAPGPIGVLGHCFSGAQALRSAAALPGRIAAAASFHGGHLFVPDSSTSPHLELPNVRAVLLFGHATNDSLMPAEAIQQLDRALAAWGGQYRSEVFPAGHGWTVPDAGTYNPAQAERAFTMLLELFAKSLH